MYHAILDGYGNASIPLETFLSDSQYMDHDQDFTYGPDFTVSDMKVSAYHSHCCSALEMLHISKPIQATMTSEISAHCKSALLQSNENNEC